MAKEALLTVEGMIDEILPDGRFGVTLDSERTPGAGPGGPRRGGFKRR